MRRSKFLGDLVILSSTISAAEIAGIKTHGLTKLLWDIKYFPKNYKNTNKKITRIGEDGLYNFDMQGMIGALGIKKLCKFIKESGKNIIAVHFDNLLPYGSLFSTAYTLSSDGYSSIIFNNTDKFMSMEGGKDLLGTNPICLCFASDPPVILDMATSKKNISYAFNLRENGSAETKLPCDTYLDNDKRYTTDPAQAKYVVPMGDYKGFDLSLMIELFSQFLFEKPETVKKKTFLCSGMIFAFKSKNINFKGANNFIRSLKDKYPGEDNFANLKMVEEKGLVEVDNNVYDTIAGVYSNFHRCKRKKPIVLANKSSYRLK